MNNEQKFNIGDLVTYDPGRVPRRWGIIIKFDVGTNGQGPADIVKVRWPKGFADWCNTDYLIVIEKAKR